MVIVSSSRVSLLRQCVSIRGRITSYQMINRFSSTSAAASTSTSLSSGLSGKSYRWEHRKTKMTTGPACWFSTAQQFPVDESDNEVTENQTASKEDQHKEEQHRVWIRDISQVLISDVLNAKHSNRWVNPVVSKDATLQEAIQIAIEGSLSGMMVVENDGISGQNRVVGLVTARDLLRIMYSALREGVSEGDSMRQPIHLNMTPKENIIYGRPDETIGICRTLMAKTGIKCLPILSKDGRVEGLITAKDMSEYGLSATDMGGKKNFLSDVSGRKGLSSDTSMADPPPYAHPAMDQKPLFINLGVAALPHPFKTPDGPVANRRAFGPRELNVDISLSEDAYFSTSVVLPDENHGSLRRVKYFGVADGVGSLRAMYDIDPREFTHGLMQECENILLEASHREDRDLGGTRFRRVIAPVELLAQSYERVKADNLIGACTVCIAMFDNVRHQLHFSNLGDSGIIVLRHIDSAIAGSLKRDPTPRAERRSDLRLSFASQQQLESFNCPYQIGWMGEEMSGKTSFRTPQESCTTSYHLKRGDIVIMATDGLFDNVDTEDIIECALRWEQKCGFIRGTDVVARDQRWIRGESMTRESRDHVQELAQELCDLAREKSLDSTVDSPFAILAKENDIMWGGGIPDDCTIIVGHVVGQSADDLD